MTRRIRALVVDDSAFNRRTITQMLESGGEVEVVGRAADGEEALGEALRLEPDVITLDLEMPRMDGFTFLRILMARRPTPVIVISSYARKANVFRALELGAMDFIAKPSRFITEAISEIRDELLRKVATVRGLQPGNLLRRRSAEDPPAPAPTARPVRPFRVVAVGASTGGPPALAQILSRIPEGAGVAMVIAQHMPARFTQAFAERLDRGSPIQVREAAEGDRLEPGVALVAPGGFRIEVDGSGEDLRVRLAPEADPRVPVPSIDALFGSLARVAGTRTLGVVLTGMGRDGREGVLALKDAGGRAIAEAEASAVVYGMPKEAAETGRVDRILPLSEIPKAILGFALEGTLPSGPGR